MRSTDAVRTGIVIVAAHTIMDRSTGGVWQDPNLIHRLLAAFPVPGVQSQPWGRVDMEPMQQPFDPPARFIHMVHLARKQQPFEDEHGRFSRSGSFPNPGDQCAFGERASPPIRKQLTNPLHGQQLELREIDSQRLHLWPILRWGTYLCRKLAACSMLTHGTADRFHSVFAHPQAHGGQLIHLPTFFDLPLDLSQLALTRFALAWSMRDHLVGSRDLLEGVPLMTGLSPRRLAALLPRLRFARKAIAGRRLPAVVTLFCLPPFQFLDAPQCPHEQRFSLLNAPIFLLGFFFAFRVRLSQLLDFFFRHALRLPVLSSPPQGDLSSYDSGA